MEFNSQVDEKDTYQRPQSGSIFAQRCIFAQRERVKFVAEKVVKMPKR